MENWSGGCRECEQTVLRDSILKIFAYKPLKTSSFNPGFCQEYCSLGFILKQVLLINCRTGVLHGQPAPRLKCQSLKKPEIECSVIIQESTAPLTAWRMDNGLWETVKPNRKWLGHEWPLQKGFLEESKILGRRGKKEFLAEVPRTKMTMSILWFGASPCSHHPVTEGIVTHPAHRCCLSFPCAGGAKGHKQPQCWSRGASSRVGRGPEPGWPKLRGACEKNQQIKLEEGHWWVLEDNSVIFRSKCEERSWPAQYIIADPPFSERQVSGVHLRPFKKEVGKKEIRKR